MSDSWLLCVLQQIQSLEKQAKTFASSPKSAPKPTTSAAAAAASSPEPQLPPATPEQVALVAKIRKTKDLYELMGLPKEADEEAIKKAHKKLAIQLHPDKNRAPGATEAFQKVQSAYECLSDTQKRAHYDRWGSESNGPDPDRRPGNPFGGGFGHHTGGMHMGGEFTPEDLFNHFFFGGQGVCVCVRACVCVCVCVYVRVCMCVRHFVVRVFLA